MSYSLEYSNDSEHWFAVTEKRTRLDCPASGVRNERVTRERLQDIHREAEFHSHRYPHVRVVHRRAAEARDIPAQ
jgi:hypothetical protein